MSPDTLFLICNYAVIPAWLLLAVAPHWFWTQRIIHAAWIPMLLTVVYIFMLVSGDAPEGASFGTLEGVMLFFTIPEATLAGWVHYLAFDLFIGAWQVRDARRRGIRHIYVVPCLFFTLMTGPVGLSLYLILRLALRRTAAFAETEYAAPAA
ncbi:MAG: DUF4281 domain-containing protein [Proteobacteria bacterium]|nr:DUF4281 domain-containing protein [Pseudomonadota bacterium]